MGSGVKLIFSREEDGILIAALQKAGIPTIPGKEADGDASCGTVVIRQYTEGNGYHTTRQDCARLVETVMRLLEKIAS